MIQCISKKYTDYLQIFSFRNSALKIALVEPSWGSGVGGVVPIFAGGFKEIKNFKEIFSFGIDKNI